MSSVNVDSSLAMMSLKKNKLKKKKKIKKMFYCDGTYCFSLPNGTGKMWKIIKPNQTADIDAKCNGLN